ncbi:MAG: hypothetical protein ACUVT9_07565 [Candidatus Bathycorpusculaceae bacterium]
MAEEALTCPFCGAPYRAIIPAGTIQVKCNYCGAAILVPPLLGGVVRQCPNHPDTLAVGLCNDCGQSYCTRCLYIFNVEGGKLHICAKCYEKRSSMKTVGALILLILSIIFFLAIPFIIATPRPSSDTGGVLQMLFTAILFLALSVVGFSASKKMPPSVYEILRQSGYEGHTPKAFLKKCVQCQKEIPIASEECPYCETKQPEYAPP